MAKDKVLKKSVVRVKPSKKLVKPSKKLLKPPKSKPVTAKAKNAKVVAKTKVSKKAKVLKSSTKNKAVVKSPIKKKALKTKPIKKVKSKIKVVKAVKVAKKIAKNAKTLTPKTTDKKLATAKVEKIIVAEVTTPILPTPTPPVVEQRVKRAYRKSGKKVPTSLYISNKHQPSSSLKDFVAPSTVFSQNGRRFGDDIRLSNPKNARKKDDDTSHNKYLSKSDITQLREILFETRKQLLEGLDSAVNDLQDDMVTVADPNDRASQETDLAIELRERDRETKLIRKIDSTLQRIDNKDYGYCDTCGVEIGMKRLLARPMANLCIDCKELQEFQERQSNK